MKKLKILMLAVLCLALILPFAACGNDDEQPGGNNVPDAAQTGDPGDGGDAANERSPYAPELPGADMGGKAFTFLAANWGESPLSTDIAPTELTGDPINDAAVNRRIRIEQEYNISIDIVHVDGASEAASQLRTTILAGDESYDAGIMTCSYFATLLTGNFLVDFKELPHIDVDKPYWNKNFYDTMAILGRNYGLDGGISKRSLECVWLMAFNKDIIRDLGEESPFDLVKDGRWTFETMARIARAAARDINQSGRSMHDDIWGLNFTGDTIMGIINSSGINLAELNDEGVPELTISSERNLSRLYRIFEVVRDNTFSVDTLFSPLAGNVGDFGDVDIFSEGRALFLACAAHNVNPHDADGNNNTVGLRALDIDFGIIPYPKWDEATPEHTPFTAGIFHPILVIPNTNRNLENTSVILEAMAYEGHKNIIPAFYENLLKTKTARDEESEEMLDFIFENIHYDIGNMFNFGEIGSTFGFTQSQARNFNVVSQVERNSGRWQSAIDRLISEVEQH